MAHFAEDDTRRSWRLGHDLVDQDLPSTRVVRDPRRGVHCSAEVVPALDHDRSRSHSHVRPGKSRLGRVPHHVQCRTHRTRRILEVAHHAVTQPLHRLPSMLPRPPLDHPRESLCQARSLLVPKLLGEEGESLEVQETHRSRHLRSSVET